MRSLQYYGAATVTWWEVGLRRTAKVIQRTLRLTSRNPIEASIVLVLTMALLLMVCS